METSAWTKTAQTGRGLSRRHGESRELGGMFFWKAIFYADGRQRRDEHGVVLGSQERPYSNS